MAKYPLLRRIAERILAELARGAGKYPLLFQRLADRTSSELERALVPSDLYGAGYFDPKAPAIADQKASGYADYRRETSNLDVAAYVVFKHLRPQRVLDIGSARGFLLEAFADLGVDAFGVDISHYAVVLAKDTARRRMVVGSATDLPFQAGGAPVVTLFETLEHLPPRVVADALREIYRATSGFVVATIPSFGPNEHGPDGWFAGKVRWDALERYETLDRDYEGPIPFHDLMRDKEGNPIEGHVTIASFSWWTKRFAEAGLIRCGELEERMNPDLGRFGLLGDQIWHLYVFRKLEVAVPEAVPLSDEEIAQAETLLNLVTGSQGASGQTPGTAMPTIG